MKHKMEIVRKLRRVPVPFLDQLAKIRSTFRNNDEAIQTMSKEFIKIIE